MISDKSDAGWATVEEYVKREVSSDSEDDRRIRKAEISSSRIKNQKMKSRNNRYQQYNQNNNNYNRQNKNNYNNNNNNYNNSQRNYIYNRSYQGR